MSLYGKHQALQTAGISAITVTGWHFSSWRIFPISYDLCCSPQAIGHWEENPLCGSSDHEYFPTDSLMFSPSEKCRSGLPGRRNRYQQQQSAARLAVWTFLRCRSGSSRGTRLPFSSLENRGPRRGVSQFMFPYQTRAGRGRHFEQSNKMESFVRFATIANTTSATTILFPFSLSDPSCSPLLPTRAVAAAAATVPTIQRLLCLSACPDAPNRRRPVTGVVVAKAAVTTKRLAAAFTLYQRGTARYIVYKKGRTLHTYNCATADRWRMSCFLTITQRLFSFPLE